MMKNTIVSLLVGVLSLTMNAQSIQKYDSNSNLKTTQVENTVPSKYSIEKLVSKYQDLGTKTGSVSEFFTSEEQKILRNYFSNQNSVGASSTQVDNKIINGVISDTSKRGTVNDPVSNVYGINNKDLDLVSFGIADPSNAEVVGTSITENYENAGAIDPSNPTKGYVLDFGGNFWSIDITTGLYTSLGNIPGMWVGMEFDPTSGVLYAVKGSDLFTINISEVTATLVGTMVLNGLAISLAIDGNGVGYVHETVWDVLFSVDLATGVATEIGETGFDANFGQGMFYDSTTDMVYMSAFNADTFAAELRSVDTATGMTTLIGPITTVNDPDPQMAWASIGGTLLSECLFDITSTVEPITRFVMANVDNTSPETSSEALEDFTDIMINVAAGGTYDVALEGNTRGTWTNYFTIFINTGDDEEWSTYETYEIGSIAGSTGTDGQQANSTITIPADLQGGEYRLRVVKNFDTSPLDPCSTYAFGQGEDYTLVVTVLDDCTGTPDAGIAIVNPEEGNANSSYIVSASDQDFANGLTYLWQSNTDGAGWVDEGDVGDNYYAFEATAPDENGVIVEWRLKVTCSFSGETSYSEIATFTTAFIYCTPFLDCMVFDDMITNVTFQEIDNTTTCSPNGYGDYTDISATVQSGGTYPISVGVGDGWIYESVSVWIDFDKSGTFDEDEFFYIGTGSDEILTGEISIPAGQADGDYRMRVRVVSEDQDAATWDMSCDEEQGFGETEDYTVIVDGVMGMNDNAANAFKFYPNPMKETLNISANKDVVSISAYNLLGQEVLSKKNYNDGKVDVSSLPSGTFIFRITFESGHIENFKVIKM